jgi:hypothetical protein
MGSQIKSEVSSKQSQTNCRVRPNGEPGQTRTKPKVESEQMTNQAKRETWTNDEPGQTENQDKSSQTKRGASSCSSNGDPGQTGRQALNQVWRNFLQIFVVVAESMLVRITDALMSL